MPERFVFIGVTTGSSSIMRIFPRWRDLLGLGDVAIEGWDLPIDAAPEQYRQAVRRLADGPSIRGALITTHKINIYRAARDLLAWVDPFAELTGEVSCLARRGNRLLGWAKDPISAGQALTGLLGPGYFGRTGGDALICGAGGAGMAIALHLLARPAAADRPVRLTVTDRGAERLEELRAVQARINPAASVIYRTVDGLEDSDALAVALPPGSLLVNATGLGKDRPGSPLSDAAIFPERAVCWELNYRGDLLFLRQALAQRQARRLRVEDGWQYFILGWTAVIAEVFERPIGHADLDALTAAAAFARPPTPLVD